MMKPKQCPFCEGNAIYHAAGADRWFVCDKCSASSKVATTNQEALDHWNRRVANLEEDVIYCDYCEDFHEPEPLTWGTDSCSKDDWHNVYIK